MLPPHHLAHSQCPVLGADLIYLLKRTPCPVIQNVLLWLPEEPAACRPMSNPSLCLPLARFSTRWDEDAKAERMRFRLEKLRKRVERLETSDDPPADLFKEMLLRAIQDDDERKVPAFGAMIEWVASERPDLALDLPGQSLQGANRGGTGGTVSHLPWSRLPRRGGRWSAAGEVREDRSLDGAHRRLPVPRTRDKGAAHHG